jgi:multiple antibiotic resistance protein
MTVAELLNFLVTLAAVLNPLGTVPLFLKLTEDEPVARRRRIAVVGALGVLLTLVLALWVGLPILNAFGIQLDAFVLGGNLILLLYGLAMVRTPETLLPPRGQPGVIEERSPAIVPLAIPMLAGPGAIAAVLVKRYRHPGMEDGLLITGVVLVAALLTALILAYADELLRWIGNAGIQAISRILGMLLMAIAFMGIAEALRQLWPALGR